MSEPQISIICNAFNHEKYIRDALDSFLMQRVNVPFEILVHDDASTDGTADIIREYEKKYPYIVKPIYQTENQCQKKIAATTEIQIPRARGKYIAFCEGDDYWTDPNKLQLQFDWMEQHPEYSICCHAYSMVDKEKNLIEERNDFSCDCDVPMERLLGNQLEVPHFATMFVRRDCMNGYSKSLFGDDSSDMRIRLYCASQKPIYYLNKNMSCYRRFTENSWTVRVGQNPEAFLKSQKVALDLLDRYDALTNGAYHDIISIEKEKRSFNIAVMERDYKRAKQNSHYKHAPLKKRIGICIGCLFPTMMKRFQNGYTKAKKHHSGN